ncbi:MAG: O-antigen polysaccharide polymerase Wzy [Deltaproteobacteria bacterium]|nr:O-antigen polysaccharide polymerase Wzy [Deltaproteobacteria bacterium]
MKEDKGEYLLGYTYTVLPMMMTFPRFLTEMPVQSLSEQYVFRYAQDVFDRGGGMGFSALAESWLNFGLFGPPLFGLAAGVLTKWLDRSPRGLFYFLMVIVLLRYFRSDFASVYKSWIVVFGGLVVIIYTILKLLGNDRSSERSYSGFAVPRMKRLP